MAQRDAGLPSSADAPADAIPTGKPSRGGRTCLAMTSARGLRQVLPEQTNRIFFKPVFPARDRTPICPRAGRDQDFGDGVTRVTTGGCAAAFAGYDTNKSLTLQ